MANFVEEFNKSRARVTEGDRGEQFFTRFYERFIGSDPEVAAKFAKTEMSHQRRMLRESFEHMLGFFTEPVDNPYIVTLARIHGTRGHNISPRLYELWLDSLVATVAELDPEHNTYVELAWRVVMAPGISFMCFFYDR